jgi:hypothetical protein
VLSSVLVHAPVPSPLRLHQCVVQLSGTVQSNWKQTATVRLRLAQMEQRSAKGWHEQSRGPIRIDACSAVICVCSIVASQERAEEGLPTTTARLQQTARHRRGTHVQTNHPCLCGRQGRVERMPPLPILLCVRCARSLFAGCVCMALSLPRPWAWREGRAWAHDRPTRRLHGAKWDPTTNISRIHRALSNILIYLLRTLFLVLEGRFWFAPKLFTCGLFEKAQTGLNPVKKPIKLASPAIFSQASSAPVHP